MIRKGFGHLISKLITLGDFVCLNVAFLFLLYFYYMEFYYRVLLIIFLYLYLSYLSSIKCITFKYIF